MEDWRCRHDHRHDPLSYAFGRLMNFFFFAYLFLRLHQIMNRASDNERCHDAARIRRGKSMTEICYHSTHLVKRSYKIARRRPSLPRVLACDLSSLSNSRHLLSTSSSQIYVSSQLPTPPHRQARGSSPTVKPLLSYICLFILPLPLNSPNALNWTVLALLARVHRERDTNIAGDFHEIRRVQYVRDGTAHTPSVLSSLKPCSCLVT